MTIVNIASAKEDVARSGAAGALCLFHDVLYCTFAALKQLPTCYYATSRKLDREY